jgi:hypothetical protein
MLTRANHKKGEGTLNTFNPEVGHVSRRKKMVEEDKHDQQEKNFHMVFYRMSEMVERMYGDYEKRMKKKGKKNESHADDDASVNQGAGGDPPKPPSSLSSSISSSYEHSHHSHHSSHKASFKKPLLKLDVKFALPMFNGDVNPEKLDNWIRQVEYIFVSSILIKRKLKFNWLLFDWKALLLYGGRASFKMEVSVVSFFPHGLNLNQ